MGYLGWPGGLEDLRGERGEEEGGEGEGEREGDAREGKKRR